MYICLQVTESVFEDLCLEIVILENLLKMYAAVSSIYSWNTSCHLKNQGPENIKCFVVRKYTKLTVACQQQAISPFCEYVYIVVIPHLFDRTWSFYKTYFCSLGQV